MAVTEMVQRLVQRMTEEPTVKKLTEEDDNYKLMIYRLGLNRIRVDIEQKAVNGDRTTKP